MVRLARGLKTKDIDVLLGPLLTVYIASARGSVDIVYSSTLLKFQVVDHGMLPESSLRLVATTYLEFPMLVI